MGLEHKICEAVEKGFSFKSNTVYDMPAGIILGSFIKIVFIENHLMRQPLRKCNIKHLDKYD